VKFKFHKVSSYRCTTVGFISDRINRLRIA